MGISGGWLATVAVALARMVEQRENGREHDALLDADEQVALGYILRNL